MAIERQHRNAVAARHAKLGQRVRQTVDALGGLSERQARVAADGGEFFGIRGRGLAQPFTDVHLALSNGCRHVERRNFELCCRV